MLEIPRHRQLFKTRRSSSLRSSSESSQSSTRDIRVLRLWFRQWGSFVRGRRERDRRRARADVFLKQSALTRWARFLKQRREEHKKKRLLDAWKAARAISRWNQRKQRCQLLRSLLQGGRRSFLGRLMLQRTWRRWIRFAKRRKYVDGVLAQRACCRHRRLVRSVWIELRIHTFRARQGCLARRRCFDRMREYCATREQQRRNCMKLQYQALLGQKREVLHRWRAFAYASSRDKRLVRRVRFDVRRRRYFLLWREVARTVSDVVHLRARISRRELYGHFSAWRVTARALRMGGRVRRTREKRLRSVYFAAFRGQAQFSAFCHQATLVLSHRRLAAAVALVHTWAAERRRRKDGVYRIREARQRRLLQRAWSTGWLRIHRKRLAVHRSKRSLSVRSLDAWKQFHRMQQAHYAQQERAEALHCKRCCRQSLAGWKTYCKQRREHAQQVRQAQEYHRSRLLQRGVVRLWAAVLQNTQNALRGHHLRQHVRTSLKKRHFRAWRALVHSRKELEQRVHRLQQRANYRTSICNPSRRAWSRWGRYVATCRQRSRCDQHFQTRTKRHVLLDWHRQAKWESRLRILTFHQRRRRLELCLGLWRSRVEKWRKVGAICHLAERVHERKLCTRVVRVWRCWSAYRRRVHLCGGSVRHQRDAKLQQRGFNEWRQKCTLRRRFCKIRRARRRRLLMKCLSNWRRASMQQKAFARKRTYFQQVNGKYPASSMVSRSWCRWQHLLNQGRHVKALHRKHELKQARLCWSHWKVLHVACQSLRSWRRVAHATASCTNRLGSRLRRFREARHLRFQARMLETWTSLVEQRRRLQEMQSLLKHKLNREVEVAKWRSDRAAQLRLSRWFQRWSVAHNKSSNLARNYYRAGLLQKTVLSWWKRTIHSKQEKVLMEAQQTIGKLSYYHPQQQVYLARARRTDNQNKERKVPKRKATVASKDMSSAHAESMQKMRRMLDPTEYASYSRFYQERGEEVSPVRRKRNAVKLLPASRIPKTACSQPPSEMEFRRRVHNERLPRNEELLRGDGEVDDQDSARVIAAKAQWGQLSDKLPQDHSCASPEISDGLDSSSMEVRVEELPLFDNDISIGAGNPNAGARGAERVAAVDPPTCSVPDPQRKPNLHQEGSSLEAPHTTHGRGPDPPAPRLNCCGPHEHEVRPAATPTIFEPTQSLAPVSENKIVIRQRQPRAPKTRGAAPKKRLKVVSASNNDARPLADILQLHDGSGSNFAESIDAQAGADSRWNTDPIDDLSALKEIVGFYAANVMASTSYNGFGGEKVGRRTTRLRVCFRMARDLALFQNDFYLDELQKVYDATFQGAFVELDTSNREERMRLEQFLEQLVETHPAYRKYCDSSLGRSYAQSPAPLSALSWLAHEHLRAHMLLQRRARARPKRAQTYWVWEPMPADMDTALEKLLPAITKYMRVLGQFFLRQAVQSSSASKKPKDYRMGSAAFIGLMKQVHVFPQLFHRRELENAVQQSCCSSPEAEELSFPEFIEALVRCSCKLRWGELDGGSLSSEADSGDTAVVIKFVMLLFAMEGQGSVLKKRNEDVSAILGFLGQQQRKQQGEKLFRFRKMLAETKRPARDTRTRQPPSVWSQVRLQFSPRTSPTKSPTRSHDTFDELTESWDGGSPRRASLEPFVFDAQTSEPFNLDAPSVEAMSERSDWPSQREEHDGPSHLDSGSNDEILRVQKLKARETQATHTEEGMDTANQAGLLSTANSEPMQQDVAGLADAARSVHSEASIAGSDGSGVDAMTVKAVGATQTNVESEEPRSTGLVEPLEQDAFLQEILSSIGDVELLLSQSQFRGSNYSRRGNGLDKVGVVGAGNLHLCCESKQGNGIPR
jgi:hypothetical protein